MKNKLTCLYCNKEIPFESSNVVKCKVCRIFYYIAWNAIPIEDFNENQLLFSVFSITIPINNFPMDNFEVAFSLKNNYCHLHTPKGTIRMNIEPSTPIDFIKNKVKTVINFS